MTKKQPEPQISDHQFSAGQKAGVMSILHSNSFAYVIILFTVAIGFAVYVALGRIDDVAIQSELILTAFISALLIVLLMFYLVGRQLLRLFQERRNRQAGAQLHFRLALLFAGIAAIPSVLVALFAVSILDQSLRGWFADRISVAVTESVQIANAYYDEHARSVSAQLLIMANDINREAPRLITTADKLNQYVSNQTALRNLSESIIIDSTGQVLAKSQFAFSITFATINEELIEQARNGDVVLINTEESNKIQALIKLNSFVDAYLLVGRFIDEDVLEAVDRTRLAAFDYQSLSLRQLDLQLSFAVMFSLVAVLMVLSSLWLGLNLANSIALPLARIITVADEVKRGNMRIRVEGREEVDEISRLGTSFNSMLEELSASREQLVQANHQLDARREFTEAVLGGVSSGVIGLDARGCVTLPNQAACTLLGQNLDQLYGQKLVDVIPEFAPLLAQLSARGRIGGTPESQIELTIGAKKLTVLARVTKETVEGRLVGYVITFDDITDLLSAQRKAAWADVARRIAHEIKNPLTPITLATERLLKKYTPENQDDRERFEEYVSIISRQIEDIGRMVDEFSKFARMPTPVRRTLDVMSLLEEQRHIVQPPESVTVTITSSPPEQSVWIDADAGLMRQFFTNVVKNAEQSMIENNTISPELHLDATITGEKVVITIRDNGPGFSGSQIENYLEPYVTTRQKGTGLGLAIAQKIIVEHYGDMELSNHPAGGAMVRITLPLSSSEAEE